MFQAEDESLVSINKQTEIEKHFGFHKSLVLLTKPGKVVAVSANDGSIQWTYFDPKEKATNVIIEQNSGFDAHVDIIVVSENYLTFLNPWTGIMRQREALEDNCGSSDQFILVNTQEDTAAETVYA